MSVHRTPRRPTRRAARIAAWAAIPAALLLSGAIVAGGSFSAFSAKTTNPTSNWTTGTVVLSDDDGGTGALFSTTNLKPGSTGTNCITVTSTGTLPSVVKLYATATATGTLAPYITLKIEQGTSTSATTFGTCAGFVSTSTLYTGLASNFRTVAGSYANGIGGAWAPTGSGSENRVYKFTYTVSSSLANTYQNATAGLGFTWETQNS